MPEALSNAAARFVDSLRINSISEAVRRGRRVVIKRRHVYGEQLTELANLYFRIACLPIRFCTKTEYWQRWELNCFKMLNGDRFRASRVRNNAICIDQLPGENLWEHLNRQTLSRRMVEAAGFEFRRAHQFWSKQFRGLWSHGDAGMANVIYDETSSSIPTGFVMPWLGIAKYNTSKNDFRGGYELTQRYGEPVALPRVATNFSLQDLEKRFAAAPNNYGIGYELYRAQMQNGRVEAALLTARHFSERPNSPAYFHFLQAQCWAEKQNWERGWNAWQVFQAAQARATK